MGIAIRELLALEFFKDFEVIAGRKGLDKEIQGLTVLEAPDAFNWGRGKEMVLSTGYVMVKEPDCIRQAFEDGTIQNISAMVIKKDRYLKPIPKDMMELFEMYDIPLIRMPFSVPYMDVMNQINTTIMNRAIRRFRIHSSGAYSLSNMTYKERKIKRILQAVEAELQFPALLYDIFEDKKYYSSANFQRVTHSFELEGEEFWNPSVPFTKHTLCDYIDMSRYRLVNQRKEGEGRVSWILIPISVNNQIQAYFVVMESRELLDYYDESSIRVAYLVLQAVYEQIMVAQNIGNIGFENLVHYMLDYSDGDPDKLVYQANIQGVSVSSRYYYVVFRQSNETFSAREQRKMFMDVFAHNRLSASGKLIFLGENEGAVFVEEEESGENIKKYLGEFKQGIVKVCPQATLSFGMLTEPGSWMKTRENIEKCRRILDMGKVLCPNESICDYEKLGPFTWLQIPTMELKEMLAKYEKMLTDEKNVELLKTLKIYLENNMNYSITAEKMYVHINTIRNRMEKVNQIFDTNWENHIERLKTEILLQFLEL